VFAWIIAMLLATAWPAAAEEGYAGSEMCLGCHEAHAASFATTRHGKLFTPENARTATMRLGCEACHGPGAEHVAAGGGPAPAGMIAFHSETPEAIDQENGACLTCHAGGEQLYWDGSVHDTRGLACSTCHSSHDPKSDRNQLKAETQMEACGTCHLVQRSEQFRNTRMPVREGHMECSSCHNAHGALTDALITHPSVNDNCQSCHADKRGPFLWEHPPVQESCLSCHVPHGSTKRSMLRANQPRLCQQCHVASRHPSDPRRPDETFVVGGSCMNCHPNIHGSNHPAGSFFMR
jgi:DmsE family decaheme c-type cytochrome